MRKSIALSIALAVLLSGCLFNPANTVVVVRENTTVLHNVQGKADSNNTLIGENGKSAAPLKK